MTQGRSPSQSQIVQVQVRTGCGRSRWGAQAGEGCIPEALLLLQLLLQGTDLLQVSLYQGPLQGKAEGSGSGQGQGAPWTPRPKSPQGRVVITAQTGAEVADVSHTHTPSGHRCEASPPGTSNADVTGYCGWQGQSQSSSLSLSHRGIYTKIRLWVQPPHPLRSVASTSGLCLPPG